MEAWRSLTRKDKIKYENWLDENISKRWKLGEERYNSHIDGFQGNPLDRAIEEAFDLLFYLWEEKRKQEEERKDVTESSS